MRRTRFTPTAAVRLAILVFFCSFLFLLHAADEPALQRFTYSETHMGTLFRLTLHAANQAEADAAAKAAFARVAALDGIMSDYRATSELMQLCQKAGGDPVKVSDEL